MGSKGSKPHKSKHSQHSQHSQPQHLPKVGSATENQRLQHSEREAVLDNMGLARSSSSTRLIVGVIVVVIIAVAIFALLGLNTLH